ncbi:hypothetical protein D3C80_2033830 [compost metagenome]
MQLQHLAATGNTWRVGQAKQFLQAHRQDRRHFAVVQLHRRTRWDSDMGGCQLLKLLLQGPRQDVTQNGRQIKLAKMAQAAHIAQVGL